MQPPSDERRRRVTINTVAASAQVSRQTVTNALLHPERVHPETLERVRDHIDRLGYRPSAAATSLRAQRAGAVGVELNVLGPAYHNAMMAPFLAALSARAAAHDLHIITFASTGHAPTLEDYERMWERQVVDSFVIADTHPGDPRPDWLAARGIPFASFGRVWDDPTFTRWVDVDGERGTALAVEHCAAVGYRDVGFLGLPRGEAVVGDARLQGWESAAERLGVRGRPHHAADDLAAAAGAAEQAVLDLPEGGAIVCGSDVFAVAALHAVWRAGRRPGVDVGIVGFDDSELARMHGLTSLAQPLAEIGEGVLRLLHADLAGRPPGGEAGVLLDPQLTVRASTGR